MLQHKLPVILLPFFIMGSLQAAQSDAPPSGPDIKVPLTVSAGAPLRVYVTKRLPMRKGQPVEAKLLEPVYAFDRIVIPAGVIVRGHVTTLDPVSKIKRTFAIIGGDFTPIHFARVEFTEVLMPDARTLQIRTVDSEGLPTIYSPTKAKKGAQASRHTGIFGKAKQQAEQQIQAKTQSVISVVRGPDKKEYVEDFLVKKLPYRPQWYRRNTRFDAVLSQPLSFGETAVSARAIQNVGMPVGESLAEVRLLTPLSSASAAVNAPVNAILSQPIFSSDHKLLLPEGTLLTGHVRHVQKARWFHRGGQLRFTFDRVEPPASISVAAISTERSQLQLAAAETDPQSHTKVDSEGNAKATEPKSRLLGPAVALIVASRAADNDVGRHGTATSTGNYGGRSLGGFSGFGYIGTAAAQSS
ncbi:MAG TPA: hypothetical protein VG345_02445, partial [Bryobacteraceae bacterium]|nr:hypothetical protein [Bryobacteraceae bacterium]